MDGSRFIRSYRLTTVELCRCPLDLTLEHLPRLVQVALCPLEPPEQLEDPQVLRRGGGCEQRRQRAADLVVDAEDVPAQLAACGREGVSEG